ncbi:MAG: glucoamylase family protein [Gelidibacter sp.]
MNKKIFWMKLVLIVIFFTMNTILCFSQEQPYPKVFFENSNYGEFYYESEVEYSGKSWVENIQSKMPVSKNYTFTKKNALKLNYISSRGGSWSATVKYTKVRGMDFFEPADYLSFWLYMKSAESLKSIPNMTLINSSNTLINSISLGSYVSGETEKWQRVMIPLSAFAKDLDIKQIIGIKFSQDNPSNALSEIYIDQLEFTSIHKDSKITQIPELIAAKGYERHVDISWKPINDTAVRYIQILRAYGDSNKFEIVGIQHPWISGYSDFVEDNDSQEYRYKISFLNSYYEPSTISNSLKANTKKMSDEELLDMVQLSNFRYYWEGCEPNSGLALENIPGRTTMIATGASGFGIMAMIAGIHRKFISRKEGVERFLKITRFLKTADRFHGVYPHFLNGETGKVVPFFGQRDNGGDLVETSFLMQGLLTAKEFFDADNPSEKEIRNSITQLWNEVEWDWYRKTKDSDFLYWHWSPDQEWVINHKLIGWNETMITYFLAIASPKHSVPASMYYSGWASPSIVAQEYRSAWGKTKDGSMYTNGNTYYGIELPVGVSNGGPLFFVHYSFLGLDPHKLTDAYTNYFDNNQRVANINLRYCIENPEKHQGYGDDFWGLTASDGPHNYSADEPNPENDKGKMTATGALASFPYTPDASLNALKNYYHNYGEKLYGYYGFHDAISPDDQWISPLYMGLNQAPIVVMIENYRSGLLWNLFMKNDDVKKGLTQLDKATNSIKTKNK